MDFASILSAEYADKMLKAGTPETHRPEADRHRPVPARRLPEGRGHPLQGQPDLLEGQGADRQPDLRHHARRVGALREAEGRRVPHHAVSEPGRPRGDAASDPDINLMQQEGLNIGYSPSTPRSRRSTTTAVRQALNMAINKQAIIDAVYQGAGAGGEEPDPADPLVLQRRGQGLPVRPGEGQGAAGRGRRHRTASRPNSGPCRCSAPTTRTPSAWPR